MKELIIIGAGSVGGHIAININDYLIGYKLLGFLDDDPEKIGSNIFDLPVLGPINDISQKKYRKASVVIGIAFPQTKKKISEKLKFKGSFHYPSLISRRAWISKKVHIGIGSIIYPGVSVNYGSKINEFVVVNMNCAIGHDCTIGSYTSLAPGVNLAGHTSIGPCAEIGIGASTIQNIAIGSHCIIGGNSIVVDDINDSGNTFQIVWDELGLDEIDPSVVRFAAMTENLSSEFGNVSYHWDEVNKAEDDVWLVYPYEV